ncbi:Type 1 glutamine amidotransferase-like domain-containing protein [Mucilaginibacter sp. AW1-3]
MKLLLTSGGISNASIRNALVYLLDKPIEEANALFVPTGIYPFRGGPNYAWQAIQGKLGSPFAQLGWKSVGLLELTALASIDKEIWQPAIRETDALLVWGGDPLYLAYWMQTSGLTELMPTLPSKLVYVGVSAGSMAVSKLFGETYSGTQGGTRNALTTEEVVWGDLKCTFQTAHGAGLVDFALIPHLEHKEHREASMANAERWAKKLSVPVYAIDDQTAIKVVNGNVEVITEGQWKLFTP